MAAARGPFVGYSASTAPTRGMRGGAVGEDADGVGAAADLAVEPFVEVVGPNPPPDLFKEGDPSPGRHRRTVCLGGRPGTPTAAPSTTEALT